MSKSLLLIRYLIYFSLLLSPFINPAVIVMYDIPMFFICFAAVPFEVYLAFRLSSVSMFKLGIFSLKGRDFRKLITAVVFPFLILINPSYSSYLVFSILFSGAAFFTTYFLFRFKAVFISFAEALFYFLIYKRLIGFSSSLIFENSFYNYLAAFYFILLIFSWFLVSFYYFRGNIRNTLKDKSKKTDFRREYIFMLLFFTLFSVTVLVFLPDGSRVLDFIVNFSNEKALPEGSGLGEEDEEGNLKGVPSDRWGNRSRRSGSSNRQYAVMVVASEKNEVYSAWDYMGRFDPVKGFIFSEDEQLNRLKNEKFVENWINNQFSYDSGRDIVSTYYLSAIPERSVPYLPFMIEPTVFDTSVSPFSYSYSVSSFVSVYNADSIPEGWELTSEEEAELSEYLYSEIDPEYSDIFSSFIDSLELDSLPPGKRIDKILKGFKGHQYEIGYDENTSVEKLSKFLSGKLTGDCTEFANTAAILGRLAGIPSRVVRGYLASENLQTLSHRRGIIELQKNIDALKDYSPDKLLLVTTAHKHAWVQFYLSDYGWIDFETTSNAIPPEMNMNDAQVIIPVIRTVLQSEKKDYVKGVLIVLKLLLFSAVLLILVLYLYKISKLLYLSKSPGKTDREFAVKRYRYILLRHFLAGYPVKKKHMTPAEYSIASAEFAGNKDNKTSPVQEDRNIEFRNLSEILTEILYRENFADGEFDKLMVSYRDSLENIISAFRKGDFREHMVSALSLRGVFY